MSEYTELNAATVINADDARGGVTGHNVRYVLAGALFLTICCFALVPAFV